MNDSTITRDIEPVEIDLSHKLVFIHGNNLSQKEQHKTKYNDAESKKYLAEIRSKYDTWKESNLDLKGPTKDFTEDDSETLKKRVKLLNEYKNFIDLQKYAEKFDSRSNLHSSVLEEFMYYLFKDLVISIIKKSLTASSKGNFEVP